MIFDIAIAHNGDEPLKESFLCSVCVITVCTLFLCTRLGAAMTVYVPQKSSIYISTQKVQNRLHRKSQKQTAKLRNPLSALLLSEHYKSVLCARLLTDFCVPSTGIILISLWREMSRSSQKCSERVNFLDFEFHVMTERNEKRELRDAFIWSWDNEYRYFTRFPGFARSSF